MFKDEFGTSPMILFCRKESTGLRNYWQARTALRNGLSNRIFRYELFYKGI
jgi:hypothetical protein